jgi:hypothetical protein
MSVTILILLFHPNSGNGIQLLLLGAILRLVRFVANKTATVACVRLLLRNIAFAFVVWFALGLRLLPFPFLPFAFVLGLRLALSGAEGGGVERGQMPPLTS